MNRFRKNARDLIKQQQKQQPHEKQNFRDSSKSKDEKVIIHVPNRSTSMTRNACNALNTEPGVFISATADPKTTLSPLIGSRLVMMNKSSSISRDLQNSSQKIGTIVPMDQYQNMLIEQYGFYPAETATIQAVHYPVIVKMETSSQCCNPPTTTTTNGTTTDDLTYSFDNNTDLQRKRVKNVHISETPRLRVIAEKFRRYKKDNIELRRLEERIVCVEYDIYNKDDLSEKPFQVMRAYFSVKTQCDTCKNMILNGVPAAIIDSLHIGEEMFNNYSERELEIIDEKLPENKPYLDDLRNLLQKKRAMYAKKKQSSLDLQYLYNIALNEMPVKDYDYSTTNLMSKAELKEIRDIILKKCESRVNNLSRKTMRDAKHHTDSADMKNTSEKSESIFLAMLRNNVEQMMQ